MTEMTLDIPSWNFQFKALGSSPSCHYCRCPFTPKLYTPSLSRVGPGYTIHFRVTLHVKLQQNPQRGEMLLEASS